MLNPGNRLWILVGILSVVAYPLYHLIGLAGTHKVIPSIGSETCVKVVDPSNLLSFCEDIVLGEDGVAFASCDPAREKRNRVLDYNYFGVDEVVPSGDIWQIDYKTSPPEAKMMKMISKPQDFHPLGLNIDIGRQLILVINLPFESDTAKIEVFSIQADNLVHQRTIQHANLYTPNALHILDNPEMEGSDGTPSFFFSNDHYFDTKLLKLIENVAVLPISNVMFYDARSNQATVVANRLAFANGVSGDDSTLFVSECNKRQVHQYNITLQPSSSDEPVRLDFVQMAHVGMAVDNLDYKSGKLVIAGHPKGLDFMKYAVARDRSLPNVPRAASQVMVWRLASKVGPQVVFSDDGHYYAASSTGALDADRHKLLVSSLYDRGILVCDSQ
ncbi:hypothetical protein BC941DRAFT_421880 [Chlamydoabsidia padenii]|nr:hypothetical protein BC941DRAFT_421880 [Chlamydoabsidia padenii]